MSSELFTAGPSSPHSGQAGGRSEKMLLTIPAAALDFNGLNSREYKLFSPTVTRAENIFY